MNAWADATKLANLSPAGDAAFDADAAKESGNPGNINANQCPNTYKRLRAGYYSKM